MRTAIYMMSVLLTLAPAGGCSTTIIPPPETSSPTTVYILDYGRHTSLMLPAEGVPFTEYAYGDWSWFAEDDSGMLDVFPTLLWPTPGGLGRMDWRLDGDPEDICAATYCLEVLPVTVDAESVSRLLAELDERYRASGVDPVYQPLYNLHFVPSDDRYHVLHNCNQALAGWLRELDCRVRGFAIIADFRVKATPG